MEQIKEGEFKNIFGSGLIDAYRAESQATYPRIVISTDVIAHTGAATVKTFIDSVNKHKLNKYAPRILYDWNESSVFLTEDCSTFIDFVSNASKADLGKIVRHIGKRLKASEPRHYQKYLWLKRYLGVTVDHRRLSDADFKSIAEELGKI